MAGSDQDKTEEPTGKKISDAHERGQFAKSQEVTTVALLAGCFIAIAFAGPDRIAIISTLTRDILGHLHDTDLSEGNVVIVLDQWVFTIFRILLPLIGAVMVAAVIAGGLQSQFKLTLKAMEAKIEKLNPVQGFGKIFNKQSFVQLGVDMIKFVAMFGILYGLLRNVMNDPIFSAPVPIDYIGQFLFRLFMEMLGRLLELMVIIAIIDYSWQRWKTHEDLKMSKQEVKDERKQSDGDPHVKGRQRQFSMQLLRNSARKAVPGADVVVTNPTHYAVALKYEQGVDKAPVVIAKGSGRLARLIKEIAKENGVPMVENKPVARLLYKTTAIGSTIPLELFQVVAQILAHVYRTHRYYFYRLRARRISMKAEATARIA
ncbi:MAG: flagellar biosynthesis protein FlhB [Opitutales bacterium]|nr:flagellar biosynthesis protein FlhB [Opitutales bacterium]